MAKGKRQKHKTVKTIAKRVRVTSKGKIVIRSGGQDHFNARESGVVTRRKRTDKEVSRAILRNIKRSI